MPEIRMQIDGDPVVFRVQNGALIAAGPTGGHLLESPARRPRPDEYSIDELALLWHRRWTRSAA